MKKPKDNFSYPRTYPPPQKFELSEAERNEIMDEMQVLAGKMLEERAIQKAKLKREQNQ